MDEGILPNQTDAEQWLPVPGFEGLYEASSHGRVKSLQRYVAFRNSRRSIPERVLHPSGKRYLIVRLYRDGASRLFSVHKIIYATFHADFTLDDQRLVDHADRNRHNNRLENLRLATSSQQGANSTINKKNTSGAKGVQRAKDGRWTAWIKVNGKLKRLGVYTSKDAAAAAYLAAATAAWGEFATPGQTASPV